MSSLTLVHFWSVLALLLHKGQGQIKAVPYDLMGNPPALVGAMRQNDMLTKAERYKVDELDGPASFVNHDGKIYTGLRDGRIVDISDCGVKTIVQFSCPNNKCPRPRSLRMTQDGRLLAVVAGNGIVRINLQTGLMEKLFSMESPVNGKRCKYINDVITAKDGTIFFTDSSAKWAEGKFLYIVLEGESTGRLIALDPWSRSAFVVIDRMSYPNGLEFGPDEQYLLIAETSRARIRRLDLRVNTPYWRRQSLFAANLPGLPDNIRASGRGTLWVPMYHSRNAGMKSSWVDTYAKQPDMREMIAMMASMEQILEIKERYGTVVELDGMGRIVRSLHDPAGKQVHSITEAMEIDGYLYLGSAVDKYVTRVALSNKFDVDRFIARIKSTCRATKITNIQNFRKVLRRLVAIAELRRALLEYKRRKEEEEANQPTTTASPLELTSTAAGTASTTTASSSGTGSTTTASPMSTSTSSGLTSANTTASPTGSTTTGSPPSTTTVSDDPDVADATTSASTSVATPTSTGTSGSTVSSGTTLSSVPTAMSSSSTSSATSSSSSSSSSASTASVTSAATASTSTAAATTQSTASST